MALRRVFFALPLVLLISGCSEDDVSTSGNAGSAGSGGSAGSAGSGGQAGSAGSAGASGSAGSLACGEGVGVGDLEGGSFDDRFTIAGVSSRYGIAPAVYDFARDTDGSWVAAGRFDSHAGEPVPPLLRLKDGKWQPARTSWELPAPDDGFSAVAISPSGALALATNDSFGEREGEIWIDEGSGLTSIGAFDGQVRSLAYFGGKLWVAGLFTLEQGGSSVSGLAVWDGTTWSAAPGGAITGNAFELYVDGATLFVAGSFTNIGGMPAEHVAAYDGSSWTAYDFDGALAIYALVRSGSGELYAGGAFGDFSSPAGVARWDGTQWNVVGGGLAQFQTRGVVTDLVAHGDVVDATGCFSNAGGLPGAAGSVQSPSIARWDGSAWISLDSGTKGVVTPWFQPMVCGDEGPSAIWDVSYQRLAREGDTLLAGGMFAGVDGVLSQSLIAHDGTSWVAQGEDELGFGGSIEHVRAGGQACSVYGVGSFTHVGGKPAVGRVVHLGASGWENLSDTLPSDAWCPTLDVSAEGELVVGCMVFPPTGDAQGVILRRDGDAMVAMDTPGLGPVMALEWSPSGTLWIAGAGVSGYVARLDGQQLTMVEEGFDSAVSELDVVSDDDVVVAGAFTKVGSLDASRIARWDGSAWSALGDGVPGQVLALERDADHTYVSSYDEGNGAYLLGAFDGSSWQELATSAAGVTPTPDFSFNEIRAIEGGLLLVGAAEMDDGSGRALLVYENGTLRALGGGLNAIGVEDIAVTSDSIWFGGSITAAGNDASSIPSVGVARWLLGSP